MQKRLESLDALRGFDLFCLVVLEDFVHKLGDAIDAPWYQPVMDVFTHKSWEGFSPWDLVMPLFMFMAGVTIPFSMEKYRKSATADAPSANPQRKALWKRLTRRFVLLWVLGMACQGNLLGLDPHRIYLFSNTLQAIAVGYLFSAIIFLHTRWKTQIGIAVALLLTFWAAMEFITIGGFGGGDYTPQGNLAEGIDRLVLGRFRDAARVVDGNVVFAEWYTYTWILSSLNFVVTVLTGVLTGELLKSTLKERKKVWLLLGTGAVLVALGWTWGLVHTVIKHIWTGSMVLVSSGYSMLLMGLFYGWIDVGGHHSHLTLLKVYGMNSITAYAVSHIISFSSISRSLFHGLEQYIGDYYPVLIHLSNATILFLILFFMYKKKIFLRV
ncbi:MAG: DUF5009 domain-containing protein [Bacteroidaceae bacterium]|nr:DUF5009 domain-containing protein [Bacteroidaceae bacterium]